MSEPNQVLSLDLRGGVGHLGNEAAQGDLVCLAPVDRDSHLPAQAEYALTQPVVEMKEDSSAGADTVGEIALRHGSEKADPERESLEFIGTGRFRRWLRVRGRPVRRTDEEDAANDGRRRGSCWHVRPPDASGSCRRTS